jgi:hypothetical protein
VVRVELQGDFNHPGELVKQARRAIRSRGASAIDAVLDLDQPPGLIVISSSPAHRER